MIIIIFFTFSTLVYSQHNQPLRINYQCIDCSLEQVLIEIQKQTMIEFVYDTDLIMEKSVSCHFKNTTLNQALQHITNQCNFSYQLFGPNSVVFYTNPEKKQTLLGVVVDSISQKTLPYANIVLKGTHTGVSADSAGYFELNHVYADLCTVQVCYIGYNPLELTSDRFNNNNPFKVELSPTSVQMDPIEVTGDRIPIIQTHGKTGALMFFPNEIQFLPTAANNDILHILQLMPGTKNVFDQLDGLYIQKGTSDQNLLLFDGIPIIRGEHLWGYLNAFSAQAVKSVKMHKAGFSSRYGGQLSSVIELEGDASHHDHIQTGVHINTFYADAYLKTPITSKCQTLITVRRSLDYVDLNHMYYDFEDYIFLLKRRYQTDLDHGNMFKFHDAVGKIEYSFNENNQISITGFDTYDKIDITKVNSTGGRNEGQRFEEWENRGIGANWDIVWNKRLSSHGHASYSQYKNNYFYQYQLYFTFINTADNSESYQTLDTPIEEVDDYDVRQVNYSLNQSLKVNAFYSLEFGGHLQQTKIQHHLPVKHFIHDTTNAQYNLNIYMPIACTSWSNIAYLENNFMFNERLKLTIGLRSNYYSLMEKSYFDPRIAMHWDIKKFQFQMRWGRYHQYLHRMTVDAGDFNPMRTSYYWMLSYSDLEPESAEHMAFSVHYPLNQYEFSMDAYYKSYKNLIQMAPGVLFTNPIKSSGFIYIDKGAGISKGIEFLLKKNSGLITGWLSYQLGSARFRFNTINNQQWFSADYDRTHEVKLVAAINRKRWQLSCVNILASGVPYSTADHTIFSAPIEYDFYSYTNKNIIHEQRLPYYFKTDIKAGYDLFKKSDFMIRTGFTLFNVFNQKNIIDQYYATKEDYFYQQKSNIKELGRTFFVFFNVSYK